MCLQSHKVIPMYFFFKDPPSKENPYEDIELERSCLGNKCYSPVSLSPVPDTPTKVPNYIKEDIKETLQTCINTLSHHCYTRCHPSLAFFAKTQKDEASSS